MGATSDIDRLIEMGLSRYGVGDLDGALLLWEEALAIDPANAQANSYVDYVRLNYELLTTGEPGVEDHGAAPYGIDEEPEYQIEILPGEIELPPAAQLISLDPVDAGWELDEEMTHDAGAPISAARPAAAAPDYVEIEADEPPLPEVNFEDATREYQGNPRTLPPIARANEFSADEGTAGPTHAYVRRPPTLLGEDDDAATASRERAPAAADDHEAFESSEVTGGFNSQGTPGFSMQDTEIRKRNLGFVQPASVPKPTADPPSSPLSIGTAPTMNHVAYDEPLAEDLIASLPTPRPASAEPESGEISLPPRATLDMPDVSRQPAALSQADVMMGSAPTRELDPNAFRDPASLLATPTRDLGLRSARPASSPIDEDAPTRQSDVRAIRDEASRRGGAAHERESRDFDLAFDPIASAGVQILEDVDAGAPPNEPEDDQVRRRITRLLEKAKQWSEEGDLDKAIAAVDLALSQDPDSALAQKLITRNRDAIIALFQGFIGDLERSPELAKPLHELANAPISPRAAFLLSRVDGTLTIDELLDVSGMPRLEAYRHLCQLLLRGILR